MYGSVIQAPYLVQSSGEPLFLNIIMKIHIVRLAGTDSLLKKNVAICKDDAWKLLRCLMKGWKDAK